MEVRRPNLDSVPIDIKFTILTFIPTLRGLRSLFQVCPTYRPVYENYKGLIDPDLLYRDAINQYPRESIWLARHHGTQLPEVEAQLEDREMILLEKMREYLLYPKDPPTLGEVTSIQHMQSSTEQEVRAEIQRIESTVDSRPKRNIYKPTITANHRAVVDIYERLVDSKLSRHSRRKTKSSQAAPSADEEKRIVEAIYRFLIGVNIDEYLTIHHGLPFDEILRLWGFWGTMAVRAVRNFFVDEFSEIENNFGAIPRKLCSRFAGVGRVRKPVLPLRYILVHEFPDNITTWLDSRDAQNQPHLMRRVRETLKGLPEPPEVSDYDYPWLRFYYSPWDSINLFFANFDIWAPTDGGNCNHDYRLRDGEAVPHQRYRPRKNGEPIDEDIIARMPTLKLIADDTPAKEPSHLLEEKPQINPDVALWDCRRLEDWGYRYRDWRLETLGSRNRYYSFDEMEYHNSMDLLGGLSLPPGRPDDNYTHMDEYWLGYDNEWCSHGEVVEQIDRHRPPKKSRSKAGDGEKWRVKEAYNPRLKSRQRKKDMIFDGPVA